MTRTGGLRAALACRPVGKVPRWELEFHAFDAASGRRLILGREFERLSAAERERALRDNAEIILSVCAELEFAGVTGPNSYWEQAPGELAYYVLPNDYPERQLGVLREMAGDTLLLVANVGGVLGACYDVEFCQMLRDAPEEMGALARRTLARGLERAKRFRDHVDCGLLVAGTPEAVYAATRELLVTWGTRTGLVLGASNAVQREVPMENYRAMVAAWKAYPGAESCR